MAAAAATGQAASELPGLWKRRLRSPCCVYDSVAYPGRPFAQTHPDRLATMGALFGVEAAPISSARVLELGCGDGENLLPMAVALPDATFVGVDSAEGAIARGMQIADDLALRNITLSAETIESFDRSGPFDFVIAHGVYSWVAPQVRDSLLALCARSCRQPGSATSATTRDRAPPCVRASGRCCASTPRGSMIPSSGCTRRGRCCPSWRRASPKGRSWVRRCALRRSSSPSATMPLCFTTISPRSTTPLCGTLLRAYAANLVELHVHPPALTATLAERPVASALARAQARRRSHMTTLRHRSVRIEDELGRHLVTLLDGTRNREALLQEVEDFRRQGASPPGKDLAEGLERSLEGLAQMGLLVAEAG